ncbi:MAG: hypothetical protein QXZ28_06105 [Candidatus Methanomethylicaceae archaeon]
MAYKTYEDGFHDALELASALLRSYDLETVRSKIEYALCLVKEKRYNKIAYDLGAMKKELL